jgi:hypothetical protein
VNALRYAILAAATIIHIRTEEKLLAARSMALVRI